MLQGTRATSAHSIQARRAMSGVVPRSAVPASGRPKVLVVDDEPLIRLFVERALTREGYEVVQAESAERALQLLQSAGASFSFLLSDVQMPGASGAELVAKARQLLPELPTQLMSAAAKPWLVSQGIVGADADVMQKPFRLEDLLARLEQAVSREAAAALPGW